MPEFFIELFSEEIPARMQARAADDLARLVGEALAPLAPSAVRTFHGPRRIALAAEVAGELAEARSVERGPRKTAPEQAMAGFLRKHGASREQLREEGDFLVLDRVQPGMDAALLIAREMPGMLRRFPWPKSMRWGGTSQFTWVRPLRRIVCLLDGAVVPFDLRDGADDGHGLVSGNTTEGHRFLAPGPCTVSSVAEWTAQLGARKVMADAAERRATIATQLDAVARSHQLRIVEDAGLLDEVAGLVEWPVPLLGRIDGAYMDLPAEVMQVSMRVNQRYFALRDGRGDPAPHFAFVANIEAADGGRTIVAGNERVLRARFSDARHFWDLDRQRPLESRVAALDGVTFHAKLGSQGERVRRLVRLAGTSRRPSAPTPPRPRRAALLAKADLTTGMVGEFPELQGVMGAYYARHDGEARAVAGAVRDHYAPKGPSDAVPAHPVGDRGGARRQARHAGGVLRIGEKPTGSGDPYALRRAALGVIRIVREHGLRLHLSELIAAAGHGLPAPLDIRDLLAFLVERLRVQLRAEGRAARRARRRCSRRRHGRRPGPPAGAHRRRGRAARHRRRRNLLAASKRAANILRIEEKKDGPHDGPPDAALLHMPEEIAVAATLDRIAPDVRRGIDAEDFAGAMAALATLRAPLDAFFDKVTVNDDRPELRRNRLRLLSRVRATMDQRRRLLTDRRADRQASHDQVRDPTNGSTASAPAITKAAPTCATCWAARAPTSPKWRPSACRCRRASPSPPRSARRSTTTAANTPTTSTRRCATRSPSSRRRSA